MNSQPNKFLPNIWRLSILNRYFFSVSRRHLFLKWWNILFLTVRDEDKHFISYFSSLKLQLYRIKLSSSLAEMWDGTGWHYFPPRNWAWTWTSKICNRMRPTMCESQSTLWCTLSWLEWSTLIGPDPSRYCAIIGSDLDIPKTSALWLPKAPYKGHSLIFVVSL